MGDVDSSGERFFSDMYNSVRDLFFSITSYQRYFSLQNFLVYFIANNFFLQNLSAPIFFFNHPCPPQKS